MRPTSPRNPDSFLEENLPDLIRTESTSLWSEKWIGRHIESYRIEELIGTGTHGVVFRAQRTTPYERAVAIKLLPNLQGQAKANRFQNECQALADLEHKNISQILTAGLTEDETPYLIMPLLSGVPIDEHVLQHHRTWHEIAELARQLAEAMAFAHQKGIVHCDLKPDNILVDEEGHVTVTDFGLAVRIDELDDLAQRPSWAAGSIGYAAPEVLLSRKNASPAVDIYSLGAVLFKLSTGEAPHQSHGWLDSLVASVEGEVTPVRSRNPNVPLDLAAICDQCLAQDPEDRFASAAELESRLVNFLGCQKNLASSWLRDMPRMGLFTLAATFAIFAISQLFPALQVGTFLGWSNSQVSVPTSLSGEEVNQILRAIEEQLLRPGLKDPAEPGDFERTFETLKDAARQLDSLLARVPTHKQVRHRTATGYFLLGRAAHWVGEDDYADRSLARAERMFRELHREYPDDGFMFDFFHTIFIQASRAEPLDARDLHLMALGVIEGLHESHPDNLDYSDALACVLMLLASDYTLEHIPDLFDVGKATTYAKRALEMAEWTSKQPNSLPIHRKHIMTSLSALSEIARYQGDLEKSLELAEAALLEATRLDETLKIADTLNHRFDKTWKYAIALRNVGRLPEAKALAEATGEMAQQLRAVDWPEADICKLRVDALKRSIAEGPGSSDEKGRLEWPQTPSRPNGDPPQENSS